MRAFASSCSKATAVIYLRVAHVSGRNVCPWINISRPYFFFLNQSYVNLTAFYIVYRFFNNNLSTCISNKWKTTCLEKKKNLKYPSFLFYVLQIVLLSILLSWRYFRSFKLGVGLISSLSESKQLPRYQDLGHTTAGFQTAAQI